MTAVIVVNCNNSAFELDPSAETARILRELAIRIDGHPYFSPGHENPLRDVNGNEVGYLEVLAKGQGWHVQGK